MAASDPPDHGEHDRDGTAGDHEPLPGFEAVVSEAGAAYNVLETESLSEISACLRN
ncbi:hypothetical protein [Halorarum halobium]|uniref:hypothetical protein n=1 Tax=Halorarum halobium TaxID=3075121 RepID=UPI0028AA4435|nr:hypothetical protein [Halobaculum sp. XH14]